MLLSLTLQLRGQNSALNFLTNVSFSSSGNDIIFLSLIFLPQDFLLLIPLTGFSHSGWTYAQKDIPDFNGRHRDGGHGLTEAAAVHHHHEEVAAWDLLDDKGPVKKRGTVTVSDHCHSSSKKP